MLHTIRISPRNPLILLSLPKITEFKNLKLAFVQIIVPDEY